MTKHDHGSQPSLPTGDTYHQVRDAADPQARIRLVPSAEDLAALPHNVGQLFSPTRQATAILLASVMVSVLAVTGALVAVLVVTDGRLLVPVLVLALAEVAALILLFSRAARRSRARIAAVDFSGVLPEQATVARIWPDYYEGALSELAIAVESPTGVVISAHLAGRTIPHYLPEQLPREGDYAWVWRAPGGQALIQARVRRPGVGTAT
ncbi:MAG: hypothetical protein ACTH0V_00055 [Microbacteriaceae bacterium]